MTITDFLSDPAARSAVVAELRRVAEDARRSGNRAELRGMHKVAASSWTVAAQRGRAANALADGVDFDPHDRLHVELAVANVQVRMTSDDYAAKGGAQ